jgi:hypothetical protein
MPLHWVGELKFNSTLLKLNIKIQEMELLCPVDLLVGLSSHIKHSRLCPECNAVSSRFATKKNGGFLHRSLAYTKSNLKTAVTYFYFAFD